MLQLILAILLIVAVVQVLRFFAHTPPEVLARLIRGIGGWAALVGAALLLLLGKLEFGAIIGMVGLWLLRYLRMPKGGIGGFRAAFSGQKSNRISCLRSAMIEMQFDHATGARMGVILAGPDEGRSLDTLSRADCDALYRLCLADDPEGAQLLQAYFDRRFPGWRKTGDAQHNAGSSDGPRGGGRYSAAMSEDEAYEVLGLRWGATRDEITRAHRTLMKKLHPDYGGSTDLAARVNEAKDVLMRRHY